MEEGDVCDVPVVAVRWYDDEPQPGLVEAELTDRHGKAHRLIGKSAYFGYADRLLPNVEYPVAVTVTGKIVAVDGDTLTVWTWDFFDDDDDDEPLTFEVDASVVRSEVTFAEGDECGLSVTAVCWLGDEPRRSLVLAELTDVQHRPYQLVGRATDFGGPWELTPTARYPVPVTITCTVESIGDRVATVRTRDLTNRFDRSFVFDVRVWDLRDTTF